jgi:hypothetical protein
MRQYGQSSILLVGGSSGEGARNADVFPFPPFSSSTSTRRFHFSSLAHDNTALSSSVTSITLPETPSLSSSSAHPAVLGPTVLVGTQLVSKFNKPESEADTVLIQFALWRIPSKDTDVTLCVNIPVKMGETGEEKSDVEARKVFQEAVKSFRIEDFGLFAGGE